MSPRSPNLIDLPAWWAVSGSPGEVLEWMRANRPVGTSVGAESYSANFKTGAESWGIELQWPALAGAVDPRGMQIAVARRPGGTALRVDSQAVWISPHEASEWIPAQARVLEVEWERPGKPPRLVVSESARFVAGIARLMNALPVVQPGIRHCPRQQAGRSSVHLRFLARPGEPPLAEAVQMLPPGGACNGMALTIRGKPEPGLEGAGVVVRRLRGLR